jgi:hypothetical protein
MIKVIGTNTIPRLVSPIGQTRFSNLLVSGCSFTSIDFGHPDFYFKNLQSNYNNICDVTWPKINTPADWDNLPQAIKLECVTHKLNWRYLTYITWPVYTRDLLNFDQVIDCSCSGAGNKHIHDSIILALESSPELTPENTQIAVMWSGYDRDDIIADATSIDNSRNNQYSYTSDVKLILTGGLLGASNSLVSMDAIKRVKSDQSRAVENFVYIVGLYRYLTARGFSFVFSNFASNLRSTGLDINQYLTPYQNQTLKAMTAVTTSLGEYAQETIDGSHPSALWHHRWAENVLVPQLTQEQK